MVAVSGSSRCLMLGAWLLLHLTASSAGISVLSAQERVTLPERLECAGCKIVLEHLTHLNPDGNLLLQSKVAPFRGGYLVAPTGDPAGIAIYDQSGEYIKTIGRRGSGPGEYRQITGVFVSPHGLIHVLDEDLQRVSILDETLVYRSSFSTTAPPRQVAFRGDTAVLHVETPNAIQVVSNGVPGESFGGVEPDDIFEMFRLITIAPDGTIWASRRERYQFDGYALAGTAVKTITANLEWFLPLPERSKSSGKGTASVVDLTSDPEGRLWALFSRKLPHWRPAPRGAEMPLMTRSITELLQDTEYLIEVIDPLRGIRIASTTIKGKLVGGFLPGGKLFTYNEDDDGFVSIEIWRAHLTLPEQK